MKYIKDPIKLFAMAIINAIKTGQPQRFLGIDVGSKCIGGAISGEYNINAQGNWFWHTTKREIERLGSDTCKFIRTSNVRGIVFGYPFDPDSDDINSEGGKHVRKILEKIEKHAKLPPNLPYTFFDETGTTNEAKIIVKPMHLVGEPYKRQLDMVEAQLILERYLDALNEIFINRYPSLSFCNPLRKKPSRSRDLHKLHLQPGHLLGSNFHPVSEVKSLSLESGAGKIDQEDQRGKQIVSSIILPQSGSSGTVSPGPSFWNWSPPLNNENHHSSELKQAVQPSSSPAESPPVLEQERGLDGLSKVDESMARGVNPDGSMWWKETGVEKRPDGVVCKWTLTRGVSSDKRTEWENKYWEAADVFGYKELGSEKSGRDAAGNMWRVYRRESMMEIEGSCHLEKTTDKWGKNMPGQEWLEQWMEHFDSTGRADKWARNWCSIDPETPLEAGHGHVWQQKWGEKYDGLGGSTKDSEKWSERFEGDGWSKWGSKWNENFNFTGDGVKQGEEWWQGKYGERWNRTWGERHNGLGWVHKYGQSSSGENWDTHVQDYTCYEMFPQYGFQHCYENSPQLRQVQKPTEEELK